MKMKYFIILTAFLLAGTAFSQDRGLSVQVSKLDKSEKPGKQYALFIAINKYQQWNPLKEPVKDAEEIKNVLAKRYYIDKFFTLYDQDATKKNILGLFQKLQKEMNTNDSLLVFYAGHGHLDKGSKTGFWIPVDAGTDELEQDRWIPNIVIRGLLSNIKAKHIFLISDSCFSGDILNTSRGNIAEIGNDYFKKAYQRRSRQVLTSGASESVPDQSDFARQLKLALEENKKPYLDPLMLFNEVRLGVSESTPLLGDLKDTGHQNGASFILFLKPESVSKPELQVAQNIEKQIKQRLQKEQNNKSEEKPSEEHKVAQNISEYKKNILTEESPDKTYLWGYLGVGGGSASGGNGSDFGGLSGVIGLSYQSGATLLSFRIANVSESGGTSTPYSSSDNKNSVGDLACLLGFSLKGESGMFSMSAGLAVTIFSQVKQDTTYGYTSPSYTEDVTTIGFPFEIQMFLTPSSSFGIGMILLGNVNSEKSFFGFLLGIQFGRLW